MGSTKTDQRAALARVRRTFWLLVAVAVLGVGLLFDALHATPGPLTATAVAVFGVIAASAVALAGRVLIVLTGPRGRSRRHSRGAG